MDKPDVIFGTSVTSCDSAVSAIDPQDIWNNEEMKTVCAIFGGIISDWNNLSTESISHECDFIDKQLQSYVQSLYHHVQLSKRMTMENSFTSQSLNSLYTLLDQNIKSIETKLDDYQSILSHHRSVEKCNLLARMVKKVPSAFDTEKAIVAERAKLQHMLEMRDSLKEANAKRQLQMSKLLETAKELESIIGSTSRILEQN